MVLCFTVSFRSRTRTQGGPEQEAEEESEAEEEAADSEGAATAGPREQPQVGGVHAQDLQPDEEARRLPPLPVRPARPPGLPLLPRHRAGPQGAARRRRQRGERRRRASQR